MWFTRSQSRSFAELNHPSCIRWICFANQKNVRDTVIHHNLYAPLSISMHGTNGFNIGFNFFSTNEATTVVPLTWDNHILFFSFQNSMCPHLSHSSRCRRRRPAPLEMGSVSGTHPRSLASGEPYHMLPLDPMPSDDTLTFSPRVAACPAVTHNFSRNTSPGGARSIFTTSFKAATSLMEESKVLHDTQIRAITCWLQNWHWHTTTISNQIFVKCKMFWRYSLSFLFYLAKAFTFCICVLVVFNSLERVNRTAV